MDAYPLFKGCCVEWWPLGDRYSYLRVARSAHFGFGGWRSEAGGEVGLIYLKFCVVIRLRIYEGECRCSLLIYIRALSFWEMLLKKFKIQGKSVMKHHV